MKYCSKCQTTKPIDEFALRRTRNKGQGRQSRCKECASAYDRKRRVDDPDLIHARDRVRKAGYRPPNYQGELLKQRQKRWSEPGREGHFDPETFRELPIGLHPAPAEKPCSRCKSIFPISEFYQRVGRPHGQSRCKPCMKELQKLDGPRDRTLWKKVAYEDIRSRRIKRIYGIDAIEYDAMLQRQGGKCAICEGPPLGKGRYHIDHCHVTRKVRGLLCHKCNVALGMVQDSIDLLNRHIEYLRTHAPSTT